MLGRLFSILSSLSGLWLALVLLASIVGRAAPYWHKWPAGNPTQEIYLDSRVFVYGRHEPWPSATSRVAYAEERTERSMIVDLMFMGFFHDLEEHQIVSDPTRELRLNGYGIRIGFLESAIFAAILPTMWFVLALKRRHVRKHLERMGKCRQCGYDLRSHKPGDRCPECGTLITSQINTEDQASGSKHS